MPTLPSRLTKLAALAARVIEFKKLDLARKPYEGLCAAPMSANRKSYPGIWIDEADESIDDLPDTGKAVIEYKVTRRSVEERDGKKTRSVSVDVLSLEPEAAKVKAKAGSAAKLLGVRSAESGGRSHEFAKGIQIRRGPVRIRPSSVQGEYRVAHTRAALPDAGAREARAYYTDQKQDARNTAADMIRRHRHAAKAGSAAKLLGANIPVKPWWYVGAVVTQHRPTEFVAYGPRGLTKIPVHEFLGGTAVKIKPVPPIPRLEGGFVFPRHLKRRAAKIQARLAPEHAVREYPKGTEVEAMKARRFSAVAGVSDPGAAPGSVSRATEFVAYGDRTRDGGGRFVADETGGADPASMRQAYGPRKKKAIAGSAAAILSTGVLSSQRGRAIGRGIAGGIGRMMGR